ncbi:MAG: MFS transporter [Candidatus Heimdallarchaeota archaeon]|nr:MFS transporter [Candidatus Heimdallarchaeota archaeon]
MLFWLIRRYLGIHNFSKSSRSLVMRYIILGSLSKGALVLSKVFFVLFLLESINEVELTSLFGFMFLAQGLLGLPTGALGDKIGERWVVFGSHLSHALAYYLLLQANSYNDLVIVFIIIGIGNTQIINAFQSWFDTNYKVIAPLQDPKYDKYLIINSKGMVLKDGLAAAMVLIGAFIADNFGGRKVVFEYQMYILMGLSFIFLFKMGYYGDVTPEKEVKLMKKIFSGILFIFKSPIQFFFVIGFAINLAMSTIWFNIMVYPIYFVYTESDTSNGIIVVIITVLSLYFISKAGKWGSKRSVKKTLSPIILFDNLFTYGAIFLLLIYLPPKNNNIQYALVLLIFISFITEVLYATSKIITRKFYLDIIPDHIRTSFYSVLPSIALIMTAGINFIGSEYIAIDFNNFGEILQYFVIGSFISFVFMSLGMIFYTPTEREVKVIPNIFDLNLSDFNASLTYFVPDQFYIKETYNRISESLLSIANQDGKITKEEEKLIKNIMKDVKSYISSLERAYDDGKITKSEKEILINFRENIISKALKFANKDKNFSEDEKDLVNQFKLISDQLGKIEDFSN